MAITVGSTVVLPDEDYDTMEDTPVGTPAKVVNISEGIGMAMLEFSDGGVALGHLDELKEV